MSRLRVAIVGAGIGAQHVAGFNANPDLFEVAVICDRDRARASALAAKVTAGSPDVHGDYDDALLARGDIDVIDICLPPFLHFDAVSRALRAGKHVICEKPLVGSLREADALAALSAEWSCRSSRCASAAGWPGPRICCMARRPGGCS